MNPEEQNYGNPFSVQKAFSDGMNDDPYGNKPEISKETSIKLGQDNQEESDYAKYTPVKALNNNMLDWIIKARVTKKYDRKTWVNARGKGYLMNIDLCDAFGSQIQATFFKEAVDKFDPVIK
jgi:ssDNA-binding replication factor A large subunit